MVKADKARAVEDLLIRMAQSGQLRSKVSEKQLIDLLGQLNQQDAGASQTKIVVSTNDCLLALLLFWLHNTICLVYSIIVADSMTTAMMTTTCSLPLKKKTDNKRDKSMVFKKVKAIQGLHNRCFQTIEQSARILFQWKNVRRNCVGFFKSKICGIILSWNKRHLDRHRS